MSGERAALMKRRARTFLEMAKLLVERGEYDVAAFALEQAAQLRIKSLLLRLFGEAPRIHSVRELLGVLSARLEEAGFPGLAEEVRRYAADNRGLLWLLEDAYTTVRYGVRKYTER